ncbi:MAG TPA: small ribosomal subunit biogenesis GTPase RsgA, partial [Chroococcidiopsis sp.]
GDSEPVVLLCTPRARLKKIGQTVMVGDRVLVVEPDWSGKRGAIAQVFSRQTELGRPPIANANQILLVFALADPPLEPMQLSRFLVTAESTGISVSLCLNKADLTTAAEHEAWRDRLSLWGYDPLFLSIQANIGLTQVSDRLDNRITVVSGPSGVGKSSLINYLIPAVDLRVATVSGKLRHGRHTTRHVELFELPTGGLLADTPGFNQPKIDCSPTTLGDYFPEVRQRLQHGSCQFNDCLHRDEPNCVVRGDWERYDHYLAFLDEAIARQQALDRQSNAESSIKVMTKGEGQRQAEPKLASQSHRRPSRRTEKQSLVDLCRDIDSSMGDRDDD